MTGLLDIIYSHPSWEMTAQRNSPTLDEAESLIYVYGWKPHNGLHFYTSPPEVYEAFNKLYLMATKNVLLASWREALTLIRLYRRERTGDKITVVVEHAPMPYRPEVNIDGKPSGIDEFKVKLNASEQPDVVWYAEDREHKGKLVGLRHYDCKMRFSIKELEETCQTERK
jgi:hypothetical protein